MHSCPKLKQKDKNLKAIVAKQFFGPRELEFAVKNKEINSNLIKEVVKKNPNL